MLSFFSFRRLFCLDICREGRRFDADGAGILESAECTVVVTVQWCKSELPQVIVLIIFCASLFRWVAMSHVHSGALARKSVFMPWFLVKVLELLPSLDERGRCALVGVQWNVAVRLLTCWTNLDLRGLGPFYPSKLLGISQMARVDGSCVLQSINLLDTSHHGSTGYRISSTGRRIFGAPAFQMLKRRELLMQIANSTSTSIKLHVAGRGVWFRCTDVLLLFAGAPRIELLVVDMLVTYADFLQFLVVSFESFKRLRVRHMVLTNTDECLVPSAFADGHSDVFRGDLSIAVFPFESLCIQNSTFDNPFRRRTFDLLMDDVIARNVPVLKIEDTRVGDPEFLSLIGVLQKSSLRMLLLQNIGDVMNADAVGFFVEALKASCLTQFTYDTHDTRGQVCEIMLGAIVGHRCLTTVTFDVDVLFHESPAVLVELVVAILTANAPSLKHLNLDWLYKTDEGLAPLPLQPIYAALEQNTHLEKLYLPWQPAPRPPPGTGLCRCSSCPFCGFGTCGDRVSRQPPF